MKFKGSIDINKPLETVVSLFWNPDYLKEWQEGFVKKEVRDPAELDDTVKRFIIKRDQAKKKENKAKKKSEGYTHN